MFFSAGIGRTGTFIVIDILIDVIREKGESAWCTHLHFLYPDKVQLRFKTLVFTLSRTYASLLVFLDPTPVQREVVMHPKLFGNCQKHQKKSYLCTLAV